MASIRLDRLSTKVFFQVAKNLGFQKPIIKMSPDLPGTVIVRIEDDSMENPQEVLEVRCEHKSGSPQLISVEQNSITNEKELKELLNITYVAVVKEWSRSYDQQEYDISDFDQI